MFYPKNSSKCRVVKKITDRETFRCLKPATVLLILNTPEPITLCLDCARDLAREIQESVPGGRREVRG